VIFRRGDHELRPYSELNVVVEGTTSAEQCAARLRALGIDDMMIARVPIADHDTTIRR